MVDTRTRLRDRLARHLAIRIDVTFRADAVWQQALALYRRRPDDSQWCTDLAIGRAYRMADDALGLIAADPDARAIVAEAHDRATLNPTMIPCPRCAGRGYHYGYGESGHDPDWCECCGGAGFVMADEHEPITAGLAALSGAGTGEG